MMRTPWFLAIVWVSAAAGAAGAGEVVITNKSPETLQIGLYCQAHRRYEPIVGNHLAASVVSNRSVRTPNVHTGNFIISAMTTDKVQVQEQVAFKDGINKFRIEALPRDGAPGPGMATRRVQGPRISLRISPDIDEGDDDEPTAPVPDGGEAFVMGQEVYIPHMGIYYEPLRYDNGTYGARLTREAVAGSPARQIQLSTGASYLERGDTIFEMDGQRFRSPADVRNHRAFTTMRFINVRDGSTYAASFTLP